VLIVEDHNLVREALRSLVAGLPHFAVAGVARDGKEAVRAAVALQPDLVLMDLLMPGMSGIDAMAEIRRRVAQVRFVILTLSHNEEFVRDAFRTGADGYLLKGASLEEFEAALHCVMQGKKYLGNELSTELLSGLVAGPAGADAEDARGTSTGWHQLTGRERSILKLIAEGNTNRTAAEYLCISPKTVEKHRSSLMHKLGLRSAAELVIVAMELGLVERVSAVRRRPFPASPAAPEPARTAELGQLC